MKKKPHPNIKFRASLKHNFKGYLSYHHEEKFDDVKDAIKQTFYTSKDIDVSYRVLSNWGKNNILPEGLRKNGGWRKFGFSERVWMQVVIELRNFGFPLKKIAKVREIVMAWSDKLENYPVFEFYSVTALFTPYDSYVVIYSDGVGEIASAFEIEDSKFNLEHSNMILISLKHILKDMGFDVEKAKNLWAVTDEEAEILSEIRLEDSNEINIKMRKGRRVKQIKATTTTNKPPEDYETHKKAKEERLDGKVITHYKGGEHRVVSYEKYKNFKK